MLQDVALAGSGFGRNESRRKKCKGGFVERRNCAYPTTKSQSLSLQFCKPDMSRATGDCEQGDNCHYFMNAFLKLYLSFTQFWGFIEDPGAVEGSALFVPFDILLSRGAPQLNR